MSKLPLEFLVIVFVSAMVRVIVTLTICPSVSLFTLLYPIFSISLVVFSVATEVFRHICIYVTADVLRVQEDAET